MYIHLGRDYVLNDRDIIGIFDLDGQEQGGVVSLGDGVPQCYVLADGGLVDAVYLSELSSAAMRRRAQKMVE